MKIPVIGVLPLWDDDKASLWMLPGYMKGIELAGGLPVMLPLTGEPLAAGRISEMADGFLFTGGTLYQDIPAQRGGLLHRQKPPYDKPVHSVRLEPGPLRELLGADTLAVNSLHHQGVKALGELEPMAWSEDGLVEAARLPGHNFLWAVQWHPEYAPEEPASRGLFGAFVEACRRR